MRIHSSIAVVTALTLAICGCAPGPDGQSSTGNQATNDASGSPFESPPQIRHLANWMTVAEQP